MKSLAGKYRLKEGGFIALFFPAAFALSDSSRSTTVVHFVSSFLIILSLWCMNFALIDFRTNKSMKAKNKPRALHYKIAVSYMLAILIYLSVGLLLNTLSGRLLSTARGNWGHSFSTWFFIFLQIFLFNTLILLIKHAFDSVAEKRDIALENEMLKRENLHAVHEALKQQINPHFLFNSLTTLQSLTKYDPRQAVSFIGELASVYRYMLQHQDKNMVTLGEELNFMRSYLYLLKIRFGDAICTDIQVPEQVLSNTMPPNTLQLLVENAVKHNGLSLKRPLHISIFMTKEYLAVKNNLQSKPVEPTSSRLGLSNISRRYMLLKGKDIVVTKNEHEFQVLLPIT
ncbi:histidine kinase [Paraflavitalea sp. CAU 1676]|uniref:sensor histidine kinase n=1 Tax=Paraflavitalea sp. CAU 1676 TaxID=3032598 RepID=UPI0023D9C3DC|nr:histidine kinase [Paraflavitalea sp. CAU 1676]MDF2189010.1 histidine kinase [Paraflavitalea sp. CAU 1676]